jgi:hypothetical protein
MRELWNSVSFGRRYLLGSIAYVLLGLIVLSAIPGQAPVHASDTPPCPETPCADDQQCCLGVCVPIEYVCCDDGTSGPFNDCACCGTPSTIQCGDD